MRSLRRRLLVPTAVGLTLLFVAGGWVVHRAVARTLRAGFEASLAERADGWASRLVLEVDAERRARIEALGVASWLAAKRGAREEVDAFLRRAATDFRVALAEGARSRPEEERAGGSWYEITAGDGRVLARADGPPPEQILVRRVAHVPMADRRWQAAWETLLDGRRLPEHQAVVRVGRDPSDERAFLGALGLGLAILVPGLVLAASALVLVVVRRGLAPLEELQRRIHGLDVADPRERIRLDDCPRELAPVVHALNAQLERLETVLANERRTTAHIAHELRTPLAEAQALAEVALTFPDDHPLALSSLEGCRDASRHLAGVVEAVLHLARLRASGASAGHGVFDLADLVRAGVRRQESLAVKAGHVLEVDVPEGLLVRADVEAATLVLTNLLANAIEHGLEDAPIRLSATRRADGRVVLAVVNACEGLAPEDVARLEDPFWRKDAAREASRQGGLGLALAAEAARVGDVLLRFRLEGGHLRAEMRFAAGEASARASS